MAASVRWTTAASSWALQATRRVTGGRGGALGAARGGANSSSSSPTQKSKTSAAAAVERNSSWTRPGSSRSHRCFSRNRGSGVTVSTVVTAAAAAAAADEASSSDDGDGDDEDGDAAKTSTTSPSSAATALGAGGGSIYDNPRVYELAFGFRDFEAEVKFLAELSEKHGAGTLNDLLELGAGPAWQGESRRGEGRHPPLTFSFFF